MTTYEFRYQLSQAPAARNDGSGMVDHQIQAVYREAGTQDAFAVFPGRNKTFSIPASEIQAALGAGNNNQIVTAYKDALVSNLNTQPEPVAGWSAAQLQQIADANDAASAAQQAADAWIISIAEQYPVTFQI